MHVEPRAAAKDSGRDAHVDATSGFRRWTIELGRGLGVKGPTDQTREISHSEYPAATYAGRSDGDHASGAHARLYRIHMHRRDERAAESRVQTQEEES